MINDITDEMLDELITTAVEFRRLRRECQCGQRALDANDREFEALRKENEQFSAELARAKAADCGKADCCKAADCGCGKATLEEGTQC